MNLVTATGSRTHRGYILSPAARAPVFVGHLSPGSRTHRGLHSVARSAGSGLCWSSFPRFADSPGLHSVARSAGSCPFLCLLPRFADSPGATFCRPLRGLMSFLVSSPPVRGLTGGYILSPAARAHVLSCVFTPGSRTHRGLHSVARSAGSCPLLCLHPRFADSPGATFCRPLRGLMSFLVSSPPVRGLTGG